MWQQPKTDWKPEDFLNLEVDLNRIEGNIHEVSEWAKGKGGSIRLDGEKLDWSKADFFTKEELNRIISNIDALIADIPLPWIPMEEQYRIGNNTLDYRKMNALEGTVRNLGEVLEETAPLFTKEESAAFDRMEKRVLCKNTFPPAESYHSSYTGEQIDAFINQIKEWKFETL